MQQFQGDGRSHFKGELEACRGFRTIALTPCGSAQTGFKMFLNITPTISNWTSDNKQFSLTFEENPLADFVELPDDGRSQQELWFSNILCGILKGALEMVGLYMCMSRMRLTAAGPNADRGAFRE